MKDKKLLPELAPDCIDWLKSECNKYVNGDCTTRSCYIRGGWDQEKLASYSNFMYISPTCIAHEILEELKKNNE